MFKKYNGKIPASVKELLEETSCWPVEILWGYYEAAAKKAGVSISDAARQFEAECVHTHNHHKKSVIIVDRLPQNADTKQIHAKVSSLTHENVPLAQLRLRRCIASKRCYLCVAL